MSFKKWITIFLVSILLTASLYAAYNALVDPFGVFGDKLLSYSEYSMTQNPRVAKIAYLDENHEKYDSYVIGCSKSSSLPTDTLNRYFDASFYNMIMYGGDLYDIEMTAKYVLENYGAENIVVVIGLEESAGYNTEADGMKGNLHAKVDSSSLIPFYFKYLFLNPEYSKNKLSSYSKRSYLITADEVFIPETGTYNKSKRDAAKIPILSDYFSENPEFSEGAWNIKMSDIEPCLESISRIRDMCESHKATLTLITSPVHERELLCYGADNIVNYYSRIAEITPFWNFSGYTSVTCEPRYFYDYLHFRNCVGDMMLARIFSDTSVYIPSDFGQYITKENAKSVLAKAFEKKESEKTSVTLPILMYHHFSEEDTDNSYVVSAKTLDSHLTALENAGYSVVSLAEIEDFTKSGTPLPEKPVLITIDDGYSSAVDIAAPILKKHNASATVALIGCSVGKDTYKDTGIAITEHFTFDEALPFVENGTLTLISHTFDMHQVEHDGKGHREGVLQMENESEKAYLSALENDLAEMRRLFEKEGLYFNAVAYPSGLHSEISEVFLSQNGIDTTFTTVWGTNEIVKGIPQTLRQLKRLSIDNNVTGDMLINIIESVG